MAGKGPGLDRSMDALRHANMGGVSMKGGMVLAVADDPIGKSSTIAYQSEQSLISAGIPVFYPANVDEVIPMSTSFCLVTSCRRMCCTQNYK